MNALAHKRQQLLQQMEQIHRMERGSLQAETRPSQRHPNEERGPYFKHQVWEDGQNKTRRLSAEHAQALAQAIEGRKEFEKLAAQFVDTTVAMTRADSAPGSKKNATKPKKPSKKKPPDTSSSSSISTRPNNSS